MHTRKHVLCEERLQPLPVSGVYDTGAERDAVATSLFRVHFDGNRYSVPARHAGTRVSLRAYTDRVLIYGRDRELIATHARAYGRGCDIANPDHGCELVRQRRKLERRYGPVGGFANGCRGSCRLVCIGEELLADWHRLEQGRGPVPILPLQ